jgi:hypothetical protein
MIGLFHLILATIALSLLGVQGESAREVPALCSRSHAPRTIAFTETAMLEFALPDIDLEGQRRIAGCDCIP